MRIWGSLSKFSMGAWQVGHFKKLKLMRNVLHLWRSMSLMQPAWNTWPHSSYTQGSEPSSEPQTTQSSCFVASLGEQHSGSRHRRCSISPLQPWQEWPQSSSAPQYLISFRGLRSGTRPLPCSTSLCIYISSSRSPIFVVGFLSLCSRGATDIICSVGDYFDFWFCLTIRNFWAFLKA